MTPDPDAVRAMMERVTRFKPWRAGRGGTGMVETVDGPWIAATDYEALAADLAATRAALAEAQGALAQMVALTDELCTAVDCEAEDIGGQRKSITILRELGQCAETAKAALKGPTP